MAGSHPGVAGDESSAVVIRPADGSDSHDAVRLLAQLGYDRTADSVSDDLQTGAAGVVYVAVAGGQVIGLVAMSIGRQFHWGARTASVDALVVDRVSRSRGVGARLLAAAIALATGEGCILVELHSNRRRRRAHQFYKRQGFEGTSTYFVKHLR
jgi:GNAT superfamily N-acetyltransferase